MSHVPDPESVTFDLDTRRTLPVVGASSPVDIGGMAARVASASGGDVRVVMTLAMGEVVRELFLRTPGEAERRRLRSEARRLEREEERRRTAALAAAARAASAERRSGKMARRAAAAGHGARTAKAVEE